MDAKKDRGEESGSLGLSSVVQNFLLVENDISIFPVARRHPFFPFFGEGFPLYLDQAKKACPVFPWPLGI